VRQDEKKKAKRVERPPAPQPEEPEFEGESMTEDMEA
jgi:hypothetical protein